MAYHAGHCYQVVTDDLEEEEMKYEYKKNTTNAEKLYNKMDRKYLQEFHDIAFDKSPQKWNLSSSYDSSGIKVESMDGKYGFPISRATTIVNNNHLATPENLYLFLLTDWKMFYYLSRENKIKLIGKVNNVKRIIEAIVVPDSSIAYSRNYLYYEIFALCDNDGNIYKSHNIENNFIHSNNNKTKRKLIATLKSVDKNDKKYYKKPADTEVRGTFYRTGYALEYISDSKCKLIITIEYDISGSKIVRNIGNSKSKHNEWSFNMCQSLKKKLQFVVSYSRYIYQKYNALTIQLQSRNDEILQLKKSHLKFKNWKMWDIHDLVLWIAGLEHNRFKQYTSTLSNSFIKQQFKVSDLDKVNEMDLFTFGIENFNERKCLIEHIKALTQCEDNNSNYDEKVDDEIYDNNNKIEEEEANKDENNNLLPPNWSVYYTDDGTAYYYNEVTKEPQWTAPK